MKWVENLNFYLNIFTNRCSQCVIIFALNNPIATFEIFWNVDLPEYYLTIVHGMGNFRRDLTLP